MLQKSTVSQAVSSMQVTGIQQTISMLRLRYTLISRAVRCLPANLYARVPSGVSAQLMVESGCRRCMQDTVKCTCMHRLQALRASLHAVQPLASHACMHDLQAMTVQQNACKLAYLCQVSGLCGLYITQARYPQCCWRAAACKGYSIDHDIAFASSIPACRTHMCHLYTAWSACRWQAHQVYIMLLQVCCATAEEQSGCNTLQFFIRVIPANDGDQARWHVHNELTVPNGLEATHPDGGHIGWHASDLLCALRSFVLSG